MERIITKTNVKKFLRLIRVENKENLTNMARRLGVKTSYLSSIENGKIRPYKGFYENICTKYRLSKLNRLGLDLAVLLDDKTDVN